MLPNLPEGLAFETQSGSTRDLDDATEVVRPGMVGSFGGQSFAFVENKLWAGVTEHQPIGYL